MNRTICWGVVFLLMLLALLYVFCDPRLLGNPIGETESEAASESAEKTQDPGADRKRKEPSVRVKARQTYMDRKLKASDFISEIDGMEEPTVRYRRKPDFSVVGTQPVELLIHDKNGKEICAVTNLVVIEDTTPPVIEGVEELVVGVDSSISYKRGVTVWDDYTLDVNLQIEKSDVNLKEIGDYPIAYVARDDAGNETRVESVVHVVEPGVDTATEEMVNIKADEILAEITTPDMKPKKKAKAIFDWVHNNVRWTDNGIKTNWIQGAYLGLFEQKGDCFVYAMTSKCLLTRAGIKNMDIMFENERRTHYWNLINLGKGWYHFDNTRRTDGKSFFYVTDEEIMEYSKRHGGSHAYNPEDYPKIQ